MLSFEKLFSTCKKFRLVKTTSDSRMSGNKCWAVQQHDSKNICNQPKVPTLAAALKLSDSTKLINCYKNGCVSVSENKLNLYNNSDINYNDRNFEIKNNLTYDSAIEKLNLLLPNFATIEKSVLNRDEDESRHIDDTKRLLECIGITVDDLRKLKVIHVAGTKGKGSTCVLTEQLLTSLGLKTGFYSSPHMFKVTERIRINGEPISDQLFAEYFWKIYDPIMKGHSGENDEMPQYFKFLTAMAFHIFLEENVDVAIVEVGIGGKYDPTNILPHTKTIGITSLGIEHTNLLGNTLGEIAWQKSGIIKNKSRVFTVEQAPECIEVIQDVARECKAKVSIVPNFDDYKWNTPVKLTVDHNIQKLNASLAIQLAYSWLRQYKDTIPSHIMDKVDFLRSIPHLECPIDVPNEFIFPLETCYWPGRCQTLSLDNKNIYFDGAHTYESIKICIEWFQNCVGDTQNIKCLIFNGTGDREFDKLLKLIHNNLHFECVYFPPNVAYVEDVSNDSSRFASGGYAGKLKKCGELQNIWLNLRNKSTCTEVANNTSNIMVMPCISSIFKHLDRTYRDEKLDILVTGSLHLVGVTLQYLKKDKFYNIPSTYL